MNFFRSTILWLALVASASAGVLGTNGVYAISNPPAKVTLAWNAETDPTVVGYNLYQGVASRTYTNSDDVLNTTNATVVVQRGLTNYFAVTAYDAAGLESPFSNEAIYVDTNSIPAAPVMKPPVTLIAQQKIGTNQWQDVYALSIDPAVAPASEFRLRIAYQGK